MKRILKSKYKHLLIFCLVGLFTFGFLGDDKTGVKPPRPLSKITSTNTSGKVGDAYAMYINNIYMPMNRKGVIADVDIPPEQGGLGSQGQFAGSNFLFSSGFFLSGLRNGEGWANAVASATLVEDYREGTVEFGSSDARAQLYVLNSQDEAFSESWQDWKDAVDLGADFYDGDGDGEYNPEDLNGNGEWDDTEDRPDLIGDETAWCVYNDAVPVAQRRWNTTLKVGVEIRQTVFAFASAGAIGNLIFVRYRFKYVGLDDPTDPEELTDVYFGVWADPDVGDATDDVVGVDVPRNAGYTFNNTPDAQYGSSVPCFMIDFFSGPRAYIPGVTFQDVNGNGVYDEGIDIPDSTAVSVRGQVKGIKEFPGAMNLPISSFVEYINGDPDLNDPSDKVEARNYMLGLTRVGDVPDPCTFAYGNGPFTGCETTDPRFWFSGDPVTGEGWLNVMNVDQRQMTNTGPFVLKKDEENEIVVAYVVDKGSSPLDGITRARATDDGAQLIFDLNFLAPPAPPPAQVTLTSSDDFIDIRWPTRDQITFREVQAAWDLRFHVYNVYAFRQNNTSDLVNGQENAKLIASFQVDNFITNVFKQNASTQGIELLYPLTEQIDSSTYADPNAELRVRVFNDPFTDNPIVKGTPYYFAVVGANVNYGSLVSMGADTGDYYLSSAFFVQETENIRVINSIIAGSNNNDPTKPLGFEPANKISGFSSGEVDYDVVNNEDLRNSTYEVTFFKDSSSATYDVFWRLQNITTGSILIDSSKSYLYNDPDWKITGEITEGFITRVEQQVPALGTASYDSIDVVWFKRVDATGVPLAPGTTYPQNTAYNHGVYYVGRDLPSGRTISPFPGGRCDAIEATDLRRVELRFGTQGKAYRYMNGYLGTALQQLTNYTYAERITAADTVGKGVIGNWDSANDRPNGYIDVPFTAWIMDETTGEEDIQLAVAIVEARVSNVFGKGNPDGVWDPGDSVKASAEMIVIFDAPYDPNGSQIEYTGGEFNTPSGPVTVWADLLNASPLSGDIPEDAIGITDKQKRIFSSAWFNAMYVIGFSRRDANSFYTSGEQLNIPIGVYPYTDKDVYQFAFDGSTLTEADQRELWDQVNVFPNPLYGYNPLSNFETATPDEPFVTFTNLPEQVTIKIYSLAGQLLRTLGTDDKSSPTSPFLRWNLQNESQLRVASGMYLAIVSSPKYGDKVLKFAIIMPQKQIQRF